MFYCLSLWDLAELPLFEMMEMPLSLLCDKFMLSSYFCLVFVSLKKFLLVNIELMLSSLVHGLCFPESITSYEITS